MKIYKAKPPHTTSRIQYKCVTSNNITYLDRKYEPLRVYTQRSWDTRALVQGYEELSPDDPEYKLIAMLLL